MNKEKLSMITLFSGTGMQERGFLNSGCFDIDVLATSDIEPDAILSYAAMHCGLNQEMIDNYDFPSQEEMANYLLERNIGFDFKKGVCKDWTKCRTGKGLNDLKKYYLATVLGKNMGDISKIKELPYADMWFYSFPCTDVSIAGQGKGLSKDSGTRSGLLWEVERLLDIAKENGTLPKFLCLENVKNLVSKKFLPEFEMWNKKLEELGYVTRWQVLNSKFCGVPQNRDRVFSLSIRKDIDNGKFEFPKPFDSGIRLKDVLLKNVDEKYYLSEEIQNRFQLTDPSYEKNIIGTTAPEFRTIGQRDLVYKQDSTMGALVATDYKQPKQLVDSETENLMNNNPMRLGGIFDSDSSKHQAGSVWNSENISPTIDTAQGGYRQPIVPENNIKIRIRKLTPEECFVLMDLTVDDCLKGRTLGISDSSLYKIAGNGIVARCPQFIAEHMYKALYDEEFICTDEKMQTPNE